MANTKLIIDFQNIKNDKLFFYEKYKDNKKIEWAWVEENNSNIYYKPEQDIEIHVFPKKDLNEFILNILNDYIQEKLGKRIDLKSKTSKPYFSIKILKVNIPLIIFISFNKGLLNTLKWYNIRYTFNHKRIKENNVRSLKLNDGKILNIFIKNLFDEYIINGLFNKKTWIENFFDSKTINDKDKWQDFIKEFYSVSLFMKLKDINIKFIDTTTEKILKIYGYPTEFYELVGKVMPKKVLNSPIDSQDDIKNYRIRMSEAIAHEAYTQLQTALTTYKDRKRKLYNEKLYIDPNEIIKNIINSGMLQYTRTINPLEELLLSAKITKSGVGNPKKEQITLDKRDLNESYFGVVAPTTTNEYGGIGLNQTLVNKAAIKDRFGTILTKEFTNNNNPIENISFSESLMPFFEYDDTTRRVMGNQQFTQFIQLKNPDVPLVQTGFESIIPHIVSDRFTIKAKKDGKVEIKNDFIYIYYNDGTEEIFSVKPFKARTKRGAYLPLEYNILVQNGQKVKKGQILAASNSLKFGKLAVGKNLVVAEMSYRGMNYEDGWVIAEDLNEKYQSKIYDKLTILIPSGATISKFNLDKKDTKTGEILIEYYLNNNDMLYLDKLEEEAELNEDSDDVGVGKEVIGNKVRYRSIGGKIADIVVKLNTKKIDPKIEKLWKSLANEIKEKIKICEKLKTKKEILECKNNIENIDIIDIGNHKINNNIYDGAIIEVYIEKDNEIRTGSKFTLAATGGKGTVQYVIPKDKKPKAIDSGLEIDFVATPLSLISRKNPSILMLMYLGKIVYFLNKKAVELIQNNKIQEAHKLIKEVYSVLDKTQDEIIIKMIDSFFQNKPEYIKKYVNRHKNILQDPPFPIIVPPFKNKMKPEDLEIAANMLNIKLNEKVYIPEEETETEFEIPVGIMPVYLLEHFPKEMSGVRGSIAVKRQLMTGQGRSGTKEGNGAIRLGLYDIFSVISREPTEMLKELWLLKADTQSAKKQLINKIIRNGGKVPSLSDIQITKDDMLTKKMIEAYFYGAILEPQF